MEDVETSIPPNPEIIAAQKEWDEISCPICLDHPHNAVLLICRSHQNGCRSYICDTSYRHSNCLDRFKKLRSNHPMANQMARTRNIQESNILSCPLCRETVSSWTIVKETRRYLDLKPRSCSRELCAFAGNYRELRRHARTVHPSTRPADVDPSRRRAWCRLESEREYGDILSAIRSAMPRAVVLGDYVVDRSEDRRSWLNTLLLLRVFDRGFIGLLDEEPRESSRVWWTMNRRSYGRRTVLDRNMLVRQGGGDDGLNPDEDNVIPRRQRRFTRSRHNE